jgi:redox-sensitive bicupin YhaK (pirin superfamily)
MTAGHGVAHAEEDPGQAEELHAVQLWVAQPDATRNGAPAFEHRWNFVGRSPDELSEARRQWTEDDGRFGRVRSSFERIEVGRPPWE